MKRIAVVAVLIILSSHIYAEGEGCCACEEGSIEVGADFLYWKAFQDNLTYGADVSNGGLIDTTVNSMPISPHFHARGGFRVYADYMFSDSSWGVSGIFTRLVSRGGRDSNLNPADFATHFIVINSESFPIFTALTANNIAFSSLNSDWTSCFNYFDLDLYRSISLCSCFEIAPHIGLRGMWMKQKFHLDGFSPGGGTLFSNFEESFNGYGLEGGLNGLLEIGCGFSLVGHLGGSLLYARIKTEETASFIAGSTLTINIKDKICHLSPTIDGFLGLQYQGTICCHPFNLHAGWEQHIIINANHFSVFDYADLTLQGLTLGGSFAF